MISSYDNVAEQEQSHWRHQVELEIESYDHEIRALTKEVNDLMPQVLAAIGSPEHVDLSSEMTELNGRLQDLRLKRRAAVAELGRL